MNIIEKLLDLHKQATTERSHYYVASVVGEAIAEIERLERYNPCNHTGFESFVCGKCGYPDSVKYIDAMKARIDCLEGALSLMLHLYDTEDYYNDTAANECRAALKGVRG